MERTVYDIWTHANFLPVLSILVVVSYWVTWYIIKNKQRNYPPCYSGLIPWLGCAVEFGKDPLHFIQRAKKKMGPIFTLKVAGKRLTFLTAHDDAHVFFNSPNLDFQGAVQQPVKNTADIPAETFYESHTKIHDAVKGRLGPVQLQPFAKKLEEKFRKAILALESKGEAELNCLVRSSMYKAVLDVLFGENVLPTADKEKFKELERHFVKFDDEFEYGSQLPEFFLKEWSRSKHWLLNLMKKIIPSLKNVSENEETILQSLVKTINNAYSPNFALLMMWASLANAIPITFWTIAFVLNSPETLKKIHKELHLVMKTKDASKFVLNDEDLNNLPTIRNAMLETIRIRSPGVITRRVAKDIQIKGYIIPAGDYLMLSPYWAHRNEQCFPDPEEFKPERWEKLGDKAQFLEGFIAFGGGRYQCPGR